MNLKAVRGTVAAALYAFLVVAAAAQPSQVSVTPAEHRRGEEQTFLTFPEWFLVFSPAEYANFVRRQPPSEFPFLGHVCQFWSSYSSVYRASKDQYPFNLGYHVMILVIGASTTVEYALRSAYETLIGRVSELTRTHGMTEEDRFGAKVAQEYVDFIRVRPWYEFDFRDKLARLWTETAMWGPDPLRKWERKYALTTEYGIKAVYGWLIGGGTHAAYNAPLPVTAVVAERVPEALEDALSDFKVLARLPDGAALVTVPRYEAFTLYAAGLARAGAQFREIAGNRGVILVSVLGVAAPQPDLVGATVLFTQPILTQPGRQRSVLTVPVAALAATLNTLLARGDDVEHVFDY